MYQGKYEKRNTPPQKSPAASANTASSENQQSPARLSAPVTRKRKKQNRSKKGTMIFYCVYTACVLAFFIAIACVMAPLRDWLVKYEASQPNYKRDEVFSQLFKNPDWEAIYEMAGVEDTLFENKKSFAACMKKMVGDKELTCMETSAGLSGDKKFIVRLGEEKIASFTLTGGSESQTEIPQWELGTVEVFFHRTKQVTVQRIPGQTVYINGVALDDSYRILSTATVAEDYLPDGIHGFRLEQLQVTDLLVEPEVKVLNADGTQAELILDEKTGMYIQAVSTEMKPTDEEKKLALTATKTYAEYMIGKTNLWAVQQLFDTNSQFFETIRRSEIGWVQSGASYAFTEPQYSEFYRYSDTLFSIKLDMTLEQTRFDGSVKNYNLNNTMFFQKNAQGKWLVMEATNVSVQEQVSQVRISFINDGKLLSSSMVDSDAKSLTLPAVTAPEGKVFSGWVSQTTDNSGKTTLTIVFEPAAENIVYLPSDKALEPMVLYALFEEVKK